MPDVFQIIVKEKGRVLTSGIDLDRRVLARRAPAHRGPPPPFLLSRSFVRSPGVFTNVISPTTKAKLRLLFEVAPLALLVEKAGGASSCDGKCVSGLDVTVEKHDQRTQICYGSTGEVAKFERYLYGSSPRFD